MAEWIGRVAVVVETRDERGAAPLFAMAGGGKLVQCG